MASNNNSDAGRFSKAFADVCDGVMEALQTGEGYGYDHGGLDVLFVLARELKNDPEATSNNLAEAWAEEIDDWEVDREVIDAAVAMHTWLGSEWYVFLVAHGFRDGFYARTGPTDKLLAESRREWEGWVKEYDKKRADERQAALAWLNRQIKKAA